MEWSASPCSGDQITNSQANPMATGSPSFSSSLRHLLFPLQPHLSRNSIFAPPLRFSSTVRATVTSTSSLTLQQVITPNSSVIHSSFNRSPSSFSFSGCD